MDSENQEAPKAAVVPKKKVASKKKAATKSKAKKSAKSKATPAATAEAETATAVANTDLLESMAIRASKLDVDGAKVAAEELILAESTNAFELGAVLMEIRNRSLFPQGTDFKAWVTDELEFKYRKAAYLIEIYAKAKELGLKWDDVKHLGWSKLAKLSSVMTPDNHQKILSDVADMKLIEVEQYVKQLKAGEDKPQKPTGLTKWSAQLSDDQHELVAATMEHAMQAANVDTHGMALEYVASSYLAGTGKSIAEAETPQPDKAESDEPDNAQLVKIMSKLPIEVVAEIVQKAHPGFALYADEEESEDETQAAAASEEL